MKDAAELKNHVYDIVGALHSVHDELGPGINEYCYQEALAMELSDRGIPFEREKAFHPRYKGRPMDAEYRIDFLCKGDVIVECKAVPVLASTHRAQLFNYMRLLKMPCGIIVNFYPKFATIERYFYDTDNREILTSDALRRRAHLRNSPQSLLMFGNNYLKQLAFGARANSPVPICRLWNGFPSEVRISRLSVS